jgi:hypothetical protein
LVTVAKSPFPLSPPTQAAAVRARNGASRVLERETRLCGLSAIERKNRLIDARLTFQPKRSRRKRLGLDDIFELPAL